jgi:hypothetical protein
MGAVFHYHTLNEAQEIKQTFASWIGKKVHIGKGKLELLKAILINSRIMIRTSERSENGFYLEFVFENSKLNVYEFTICNGLLPITGTLSVSELKANQTTLNSNIEPNALN